MLPDEDAAALAARVLGSNGKLRVVVAPPAGAQLAGAHRSPATALVCLGGRDRRPLVTTHNEHGVSVVVDLNACFFTPRLATERLRVARAVARDERVLCLFAGCGAEALIIAATTACSKVACVEVNPVATRCLGAPSRRCRRSKGDAAADRVEVVCADVLDDLAARARGARRSTACSRRGPRASGTATASTARPRTTTAPTAAAGPTGSVPGGDLARSHADGRRPLDRLRRGPRAAGVRADADVSDRGVCALGGRALPRLHSAKAGSSSVAARQYRVTVDFRLADIGPRGASVHPAGLPLRGSQNIRAV